VEDEENRNEDASEHEWEDVLDETKLGNIFPDHTSTVRWSSAKRFGDRLSMGNATRRKSSRLSGLFAVTEDEYLDEPSFTLRDILLKVGQDGMLGVNGTFNIDLIRTFPSCFLADGNCVWLTDSTLDEAEMEMTAF
jgi:hypothetical protein